MGTVPGKDRRGAVRGPGGVADLRRAKLKV